MRMFWTIFFLGSMLAIGLDVNERRKSPAATAEMGTAEGDATGFPTPKM